MLRNLKQTQVCWSFFDRIFKKKDWESKMSFNKLESLSNREGLANWFY